MATPSADHSADLARLASADDLSPVSHVLLTDLPGSFDSVDPVGPIETARPAESIPHPIARRSWRQRIAAAVQWCFGCVSLVFLLAVVATIPLLQLLSLGYLLEVSGRVAKTGRLSCGFFGMRKAAVAGGILLGGWLLLWPLRLAGSLWWSALLIDPGSRAAMGWRRALFALTLLLAVHALGACFRGARLRDFLLPRPILTLRLIFRRRALAEARDAVWAFFVGLRLPYYFWLGARGFFGALVWLAVPTSLLAAASRLPPGAGFFAGLAGGALLTLVLVHLPFLQAAFAAENRLGAMFEFRRNRQRFGRAPLAYACALLGTLVLALPLFLLKIEMIPQEAAWLPSVLFVASMFPARLLTGWAWSRAERAPATRHWAWRGMSRLVMLPVAGFYVGLVYLTQYLSWYGVWSLYEQHAFLVPVPFLGF